MNRIFQTLRAAANITLDARIHLESEVTRVDLLGDIAGIASFEELLQRSVETELYGMAIRVASLDDLIAMKRAANRPKDQGHLLELLALKRLIEEKQA
jgi:predicted nucleotidyltransferase